MDKKKKLCSILFMLVIFGLTSYAIFSKNDLSEILYWIRQIRVEYLVVAMLFVPVFVCCESVIICYLMKHIGVKVSFARSCMYSFIGFFYSSITPSASGGQPMQMVYMKKDKIGLSESSIVLLIITMAYKLVLVLIGGVVMLLNFRWLHRSIGRSITLCYLGMVLNILCVLGMGFLLFSKKVAPYIVLNCEKLLVKIRILKSSDCRRKKLDDFLKKYRGVSKFLKNNREVFIPVMCITFVQRVLMFVVTYFVYKAFRLQGTTFLAIVILQAIISLSVDMLPLPGGMGVSEGLFVKIFRPVFGHTLVVPAMLLSRWVSFYVLLFLSGVITLLSSVVYGRLEAKAIDS